MGNASCLRGSGVDAVQALFEQVIARIRAGGLREVYPSFDAVPVSKKSSTLFAVVEPKQVQMDAPFADGSRGAVPFTAVYSIHLLIPMTQPLETAEDVFYGTVLPSLAPMGCVLCEVVPAHVDVKLGRVVMEAKCRQRGVYLREGADA